MKAIFGVTASGILHVQHLLHSFKAANPDYKVKTQLLGNGDSPSETAKVIIVQGVHQFVKHMKVLNESKAVVFVLDNPVRCEYLKPIVLLDVLEKKLSFQYRFAPISQDDFNARMIEALNNKEPVRVKHKSIEVIPTLLSQQLSTVLNPVQDYLYSLRDTDNRLRHQKVIFEWLVSKGDAKQLRKLIVSKFYPSGKVPKALDTLLEFFSTDEAKRSQLAFHEAVSIKAQKGSNGKPKPVNVKSLAKKHGIEPYDIRYTLKVIRKFGRFQEVEKTVAQLYHSNEKAKAYHAEKENRK